jgi:hypothetical protein
MSLHQAAKYLASKGRGEDTVLIHMTPKEVGSLQALAKAHGGSLSINPNTGLPEAGFLSSILPMVAGAALTPFVGPMGAAMIVGGVQTARTGSLMQGLSSGLGAYGGANIGAGITGAGAAEIGKAATENAVQNATAQGLTGEAYNQAIQNSVADKMANASYMDKFSAGISNPSSAIDAMGGGFKAARYGLSAVSPYMMQQPEAPEPAKGSGPNPYSYRFERGEASPFPQADAGGVERNYFPGSRYVPLGSMAGGGIADAMPPGQPVIYAARGGSMYNLGDYSDGGRLLRGPGDGVSDSIPATIGNKRPARLADGEFVVPARIVSELGNGSTEAGARKLYAMMDRVQRARGKTVGKERVAKNTRADKYLPA